MILANLKRWGTWPARVASALLIFYGVFLLIRARIALDSPDLPAETALQLPEALAGAIDGVFLIATGVIAAGLTWLARRKKRGVALFGIVMSFFAGGLVSTYAIAAGMTGARLAGAIIAGACLLLAAGSTLIGDSVFDN
jgi:hypothetical protein